MQKSKLGISVNLLGAIACFAALFSGYMVTALIMGYVLLMEQNEWLKKTVVKAMLVLIVFSAANAIIGLIPDAISLISSILGIFGGYFSLSFLTSLVSACREALSIVQKLLLLLMGYKALNMGVVKIGFIDRVVDKQFEGKSE